MQQPMVNPSTGFVRCIANDRWLVSGHVDDNRPTHWSGTGLFAPKTIRSQERKFQVWNFRSMELSLPGTFAPWNFRSLVLSKRIKDGVKVVQNTQLAAKVPAMELSLPLVN